LRTLIPRRLRRHRECRDWAASASSPRTLAHDGARTGRKLHAGGIASGRGSGRNGRQPQRYRWIRYPL